VRNLVILQARMSSSRLPGKVLRAIKGKPMIEWQIRRIRQSSAEQIILATSSEREDDPLCKVVGELEIDVFRGSLNDVHSRFESIIENSNPPYFIRLTGDCPLVMPELLDQMINHFESHNYDYLSNTQPPTYPDGLDIEIISSKAFLEYSKLELSAEDREHVTLGITKRPDLFNCSNYFSKKDLSSMRWTVDYEEDFNFVSDVYGFFQGQEMEFTIDDILDAINSGKIRESLKTHLFRNITLAKGIKIE
jgi:spore coat polysaccharide biosynthesis protein SpsF